MANITGVHHIAIRTSRFDDCIRFYTEVLGLSLHAAWTVTAGRAALVAIAPGSYIEIFERPAAPPGEKPAILHFALRTDDVDGMVERARSAGTRVSVEPCTVPLETSIGHLELRLAFLIGPDGEEVELMSSPGI